MLIYTLSLLQKLNFSRKWEALHQNLPLVALLVGSFCSLCMDRVFEINGNSYPIGSAYVQAIDLPSYETTNTLAYFLVLCAFVFLIVASILSSKFYEFGLAGNWTALCYKWPEVYGARKNPTLHLVVLFFVIAGLFVSAENLISLALTFVGLNVVLYGLMLRDSTASADATLKYFALGAVATSFLFFGIFLHAVCYGSVDYSSISFLIARNYNTSGVLAFSTLQAFAFLCVFTAFLFKLGVYPYHFYLADVYEGVRLETLVIITIPVKFVVFFAMLNYFETLWCLTSLVQPLLSFIGLGAVITGSYGAFHQQRLRTFWAYSYIGSMGFVFLGFKATAFGYSATVAVYYFFVYLLTWLAILLFFLTVFLHTRVTRFRYTLSELRYISQLAAVYHNVDPVICLLFQMLLLSLAGMPPSFGFFTKMFVMATCFDSWYSFILLFGLLTVLPVNAYNYFRLIQALRFQLKPVRLAKKNRVVSFYSSTVWLFFLTATFFVFLAPYLALDFALPEWWVFGSMLDGTGLEREFRWSFHKYFFIGNSLANDAVRWLLHIRW